MLDTCAFRRNRWRSRKNSGNFQRLGIRNFWKMLHFGKIPKKFGQIWRKFSKILAKFANFWKKTAKISAIFNENFEIRDRCKGVHCVNLGESFPTSIYLQNLASIQPRTSLFKFFTYVNQNVLHVLHVTLHVIITCNENLHVICTKSGTWPALPSCRPATGRRPWRAWRWRWRPGPRTSRTSEREIRKLDALEVWNHTEVTFSI